ncbi:hypothetical protein C8R47DRAFT_400092 [Mycena vitilis]|nr:hypothetical protein C8R47DRAFT_400092 [Mycena vitilis]
MPFAPAFTSPWRALLELHPDLARQLAPPPANRPRRGAPRPGIAHRHPLHVPARALTPPRALSAPHRTLPWSPALGASTSLRLRAPFPPASIRTWTRAGQRWRARYTANRAQGCFAIAHCLLRLLPLARDEAQHTLPLLCSSLAASCIPISYTLDEGWCAAGHSLRSWARTRSTCLVEGTRRGIKSGQIADKTRASGCRIYPSSTSHSSRFTVATGSSSWDQWPPAGPCARSGCFLEASCHRSGCCA